ncbi:AMP-binding protein [Nocardia neocaledoniensis]|uniref:AMP-binding protein n=1 Tax=Nocardia neocaledoniensis TaxID=236511 RepID=UPI0024553256|nr:AMP-binding protein [Nocardia neocaledoniensis]
MTVEPVAVSPDFAEALARIRAVQAAAWPAEVPRAVTYPIESMAVVDYLRHWASTRPEVAAIAFYGRDISYAEYDDLSDRFAGWLLANGVEPGDRIGVFLGNCPQFLIAMLGILKAGAVHVPINPLFRAHELRHELVDAGVTVLLAQHDLAPLVAQVRADTPVRLLAVTALADMFTAEPAVTPPFDTAPVHTDWHEIVESPRAPARPADPDALAALNYTGGTTGMPKGCEHTQRHMVYTAATATIANGFEPGGPPRAVLNFLPVFWIAGEDFGILFPLIGGGTAVLMNRWDAPTALTLLSRYRVSSMIGMVDNYVEMMDHPAFDPATLDALENTTGVSFVVKLNAEIRARWRAAVGTTLREASYGMTETHTADTFTLGLQDDDYDLRSEPVFCGLPVPGTDILIIDDAGTPVPLGQEGQIIVRSPSILTRYYGNREATAETLRDGWLHTGDVGKLNERGALHYLARNKEMIKVNGMSVFPSEVESLLTLHPEVQTVGVVPAADARRGQVPLAFVQLRPGSALTASELRAWAGQNMAGYKVPLVEILDALPMTATGKIRKGELFTRAEHITTTSEDIK